MLLQRVGVFVGGFTLDACEGVCSGGVIEKYSVLDLLTSLVDKSLVIYDEGRYRLLETVRQYGLEKLTSAGASTELRGRHRDWYSQLAATAKEKLSGAEMATWLDILEVEHGNLRNALEWCTEEAKTGDVQALNQGLNMAANIQTFWDVRCHWGAAGEILSGLLTLRNGREESAAVANALNAQGMMLVNTGDYPSGRECYLQALAINRQTGNRDSEAGNMAGLGLVAYYTGDYLAAREYYEQALAINRETGNRNTEAAILCNLGIVAANTGDYAAAREYYEQSLSICRETGNRDREAGILNNLGIVARNSGDYAAARVYYGEALAINHDTGNRNQEASNLTNIGEVAATTGDYAAARQYYDQALGICRQTGNVEWESANLANLGIVAANTGDYPAAREFYERSLAINRATGNRDWEATNLSNLGFVAANTGDYTAATEYFGEALGICRETGNRAWEAENLIGLGLVAVLRREYPPVLLYLQQAMEIASALGAMQLNVGALDVFCIYHSALEEYALAARLFGSADAARASMGAPRSPSAIERQRRWRVACEAALGHEAYAACLQEGSALTLDEACALAVDQTSS